MKDTECLYNDNMFAGIRFTAALEALAPKVPVPEQCDAIRRIRSMLSLYIALLPGASVRVETDRALGIVIFHAVAPCIDLTASAGLELLAEIARYAESVSFEKEKDGNGVEMQLLIRYARMEPDLLDDPAPLLEPARAAAARVGFPLPASEQEALELLRESLRELAG